MTVLQQYVLGNASKEEQQNAVYIFSYFSALDLQRNDFLKYVLKLLNFSPRNLWTSDTLKQNLNIQGNAKRLNI